MDAETTGKAHTLLNRLIEQLEDAGAVGIRTVPVGAGFVADLRRLAAYLLRPESATGERMWVESVVQMIVDGIEDDVMDRRGIKWEFEQVSSEVREEIRTAWTGIVRAALAAAPTEPRRGQDWIRRNYADGMRTAHCARHPGDNPPMQHGSTDYCYRLHPIVPPAAAEEGAERVMWVKCANCGYSTAVFTRAPGVCAGCGMVAEPGVGLWVAAHSRPAVSDPVEVRKIKRGLASMYYATCTHMLSCKCVRCEAVRLLSEYAAALNGGTADA